MLIEVGLLSIFTLIEDSDSSTVAPASISFAVIGSICFGMQLFITTSPFVAAAATMKVPVSI